jgi:uncharacterized protein YyaL (SSP411 family)
MACVLWCAVLCCVAGGYFQTSGSDASVLLRLKEDYDGAEPAASSVAAMNLIRLAALLPQGGGLIAEHAAAHVHVHAGSDVRAICQHGHVQDV